MGPYRPVGAATVKRRPSRRVSALRSMPRPGRGSIVDERLPEAGWYPDPAGGSALRYWDGQRWASSSGDRLSTETGRDATGDATQPIDLDDQPPAPNRADAWESYPTSGSFTRGPLRPLAVALLLV